jgi:hypothetical protein
MQNNLYNNEENKNCCQNCEFFEPRTSFCRRYPPTPMIINVGGVQVTTSNFPKISIPDVDWCGEFNLINN